LSIKLRKFSNTNQISSGTRAARKAIIIGLVLVWNEQYSGCFGLFFSVTSVFQRAEISIKPEYATIIVGFMQLFGAGASNLLVDRLGRKPLLIFATLSVAVGMTVFGIAEQLIESGVESNLVRTIPIVALAWVMVVANFGIFSLTFVILSEISPQNVSFQSS
jgi:MFS family permease